MAPHVADGAIACSAVQQHNLHLCSGSHDEFRWGRRLPPVHSCAVRTLSVRLPTHTLTLPFTAAATYSVFTPPAGEPWDLVDVEAEVCLLGKPGATASQVRACGRLPLL